MLHRPITVVSVVYFLGVIVPAMAIVWLTVNGADSLDSLDSFDPAVFALGLLSTVIGYGIWKVRPWGYYSFLASAGFVIICLFYQFSEMPTMVDFLVFVCFAVFMGISSFFLQAHIHASYFNPNTAWGRRDPRFQVEVNIHFEVNGQSCIGGLYDISAGGCFAALDTKLKAGEVFDLRMSLQDHDLLVPVKVVRVGDDPKGYGLMFTSLNRDRRRIVQNIINYLRSEQWSRAA
jgi:hypothetical protein